MKILDKNKDKRFTHVNESLVAVRKIEIAKLEKESKRVEKNLDDTEKKLQEINNNIKKQRVIKKITGKVKYQIICPCGNVYGTDSDPYSRLIETRAICKVCRKRLE